MNRRVEIAELLLDRGARVKAHGVGGFAALHMAAGVGNTRMVQMLLDRGADVMEPAAVRVPTPVGGGGDPLPTPVVFPRACVPQDGTTPIAVAMREEQEMAQRVLENRMKRRAEEERRVRRERRLGWMYEGEEDEDEEAYTRGLK